MEKSSKHTWIKIAGSSDVTLAKEIAADVADLIARNQMPVNEPERVAELSTAISRGAFMASFERMELLRGLCQIYSAGIRSEKITSHRKLIGPVIVFMKKGIFRVVSALLGPTFQLQRDFNAGVIRILGDLCNESSDKKR